jgi:hypothetical protein
VTRQTGEWVAGGNADEFARDWQAVRGDADIQFAPLEPRQPSEPPQWWLDFEAWLGEVFGPLSDLFAGLGSALGMSGEMLMWLTLGAAVLLVVVVIGLRVAELGRRRQRAQADDKPPEWAPDTGEALALLEDADRLAAEGRFDEATHLLLKRSVGQIAAARPGLLDPSSTAREIARLPALPDAARGAFATIAERVERSLFALRRLDAADWRVARSAYADFALATPVPA